MDNNAHAEDTYVDLPLAAQKLHDLSDEKLAAEAVKWTKADREADAKLALILRAARLKYEDNIGFGVWCDKTLGDEVQRHVLWGLMATHRRFGDDVLWGLGRSKLKLLISAPTEVVDEIRAQYEKGTKYTVQEIGTKIAEYRTRIAEPNEKVANNLKGAEAQRAAADRADTAKQVLGVKDQQRVEATKASKEHHKQDVVRRTAEESHSTSYQQLGFMEENRPAHSALRQLREKLVAAYDPSNYEGITPADKELLKRAMAVVLAPIDDILPPKLKQVS